MTSRSGKEAINRNAVSRVVEDTVHTLEGLKSILLGSLKKGVAYCVDLRVVLAVAEWVVLSADNELPERALGTVVD
jgi:hypothetical protein